MDQTTRIGRYTLVRRVGAGAFATVWLAHDDELDAEVALKILSDNWIDEHDVRRRFLAEGRFLRRVDSPYVIGVHDVGETGDGRPYLVLTYADGGTLDDRIKQGRLGIPAVVDVIGQVGEGLQQLHRRGVLHRDVKPANVLFRSVPDGGERAMLGDLGLGKSLENVSQLTMPAGTPAYVAPEQVMGDRLDQRADLYSLGAVAYTAFTGQTPHGAVSLAAVLRIETPPPAMRTLRDDFPAAVDAVVRRALEPDREQRWPDVDSFLDALRSAHETGELPPGSKPREVVAPRSSDSRDDGTPAGADGSTPGAVAAGPGAAGLDARASDFGAAASGPGVVGPSPGVVASDSAAVAGSSAAAPVAVAPTAVRRSSGWRWIVAGTLALALAAGGGIASYELVSRRPVKVTEGPLSVEVPRAWSQKSANGWVPVAGQPTRPGLLVSPDTRAWQQNPNVPGVFLGLLTAPTLPRTVPAPPGCRRAEPPQPGETGGRPMVTFRFTCGTNPPVVERYVRTTGADALRIQVRTPDPDHLADVLASATPTT